MAEFRFSQLGLASILKQGRLSVPPNQRNYSWTKEEVTTLLQDFARSIGSEDAPYFVGTIVTIRKGEDKLEVVDGQQRLATTAILLAEIHNYLQDCNETLLCRAIQDFLFTIDLKGREEVPRLTLNLDDNDYFRARLTGENPISSTTRPPHCLLEDAFTETHEQVRKIVSTFDRNYHGDILTKWIEFLKFRAMAVVLEAPSEADAYRIFETLNDRGLRITQADLVKNYLFGRSADRINEVKHRWSQMQGALRTIREEDWTIRFLRHALTLKEGLVREKNVHEVVQNVTRGPQSVVTLADELARMAATYVAIYNADHEKWNAQIETRKAVEVLNLVDVKPMRPLILAIAEKMQEKEINKAMSLCVSAAVRLMIAMKTRVGNVEKGFADAAQKTYCETLKTSDALRTELLSFIPSDTEFQQVFITACVSNSKLARYYLRSLELTAGSVNQPWCIPNDNSNEINLEHVLPGRTEENWPQFSKEEREQYWKRIGNLCLLQSRENSTLKSSPYRDKKPVYKNSQYRLTNQIAEVDEWTTSAIEDRQKELSKLALRAWPF